MVVLVVTASFIQKGRREEGRFSCCWMKMFCDLLIFFFTSTLKRKMVERERERERKKERKINKNIKLHCICTEILNGGEFLI